MAIVTIVIALKARIVTAVITLRLWIATTIILVQLMRGLLEFFLLMG